MDFAQVLERYGTFTWSAQKFGVKEHTNKSEFVLDLQVMACAGCPLLSLLICVV